MPICFLRRDRKDVDMDGRGGGEGQGGIGRKKNHNQKNVFLISRKENEKKNRKMNSASVQDKKQTFSNKIHFYISKHLQQAIRK